MIPLRSTDVVVDGEGGDACMRLIISWTLSRGETSKVRTLVDFISEAQEFVE